MVQEMVDIAKAMFENFATSKAINDSYVDMLAGLKYPELVVQIINEFGVKYPETKVRPTPRQIKDKYFSRFKKDDLSNRTQIKCHACNDTGHLIAIEDIKGLIDWRKDGTQARNDPCISILYCYCKTADNILSQKHQLKPDNNTRRNIAVRYAFGAINDDVAKDAARDYINECLTKYEALINTNETLAQRQ